MNDFETSPISGTEGARYPFFSPDGKSIGFFADNLLKMVPLGGGPPETLAPAGDRAGASWRGNDIVYAHMGSPSMFRLSDAGRSAEELTSLDGRTERWPDLLPDGSAVLFTIIADTLDEHQIGVRSLETGEAKILLKGTHPRYVATGHLLFAWQQALWAVPFDLETLDVVGEPTRLIERLRVYNGGMAHYSVSDTGTLVYRTGSVSSQTQLFWIGRDGKREPISEVGEYSNPELSPDGSQLIARKDARDLWLLDLRRGTSSRFTRDGTHENGVWAPDGKRLAYGSRQNSGDFELRIESIDASQPMRRLQWPLGARPRGVLDWSRDGRTLLIRAGNVATSYRAGVVNLDGGEPFLFESAGGLDQAQMSPDGRWLAYTAVFRGVVVASFPEPSTVLQVAGGGAHQPRWSSDGKELFYRLLDGTLVSVGVHERGDSFRDGPVVGRLAFSGVPDHSVRT